MKFYPNVTKIFIIWLTAVLAVSYISFFTIPHSGKFDNSYWDNLSNWDGGHYLGIARAGYSEKFQYAFFPLYPLLIKVVASLTQNFLLAGVLISVISSFLGVQLLYRLAVENFDKKIAEKAVLALLFFPTSFFLLAVYSEGLFFFLAVLTFYLQRKNKFFWATIAAALVSATRLVGLAVVVGFWIEVYLMQGVNRKNWFILFAPLGFVIYSVFLYRQTGDPFYFIVAENHWQRALTSPVVGFWETLKLIFASGINALNFNNLLDLIFAVFGLGLAIRAFRFLSPAFAFYSLLSVGLPLFTPTLSSMPRFLIVVFPIFILMALIKNHYLELAYEIFALMLLAIFVGLFINGYWMS